MAIELWFADRDPISIHTLAWASLQLVHDLGSKPGVNKPSDLILSIRKLDKPDRKKSGWVTAIGKHADRRFAGHNAVEYPPAITEDVIFEAICCCRKAFNDLTPWMRVFATWYVANYPELFQNMPRPTLIERLGGGEYLARLSRREFAKQVVPVLSREDFWFPPPSQESGQR
jgi:hypothetical protein